MRDGTSDVRKQRNEAWSDQRVLDAVSAILARLSAQKAGSVPTIGPDSSLTGDLGLTSLELVDLALDLEATLPFDEFPMQEWIDQENERESSCFTVGSLVTLCQALIARQGTAATGGVKPR